MKSSASVHKTINRRTWIKTSLGLAAVAGMSNSLYAGQVHPMTGRWIEADISSPAVVKARLTSNENPYGPSEKAKNAIIQGFKDANLYSRHVAIELKGKIAKLEGVKMENLFLCAGLSEILNQLGAVTGLQSGEMISAHPTFDLMPLLNQRIGGKWVQIPLNGRYEHDLPAMEAAVTDKTKLVYICNPGNPCSTIVNPTELKDFCNRVSKRTLVFVDEAYNDYIPEPSKHSMLALINEGKNVMIGKTLSKVHGFAGLRIAYIIAQPALIKEFEKYHNWDFSMNAPSMHGAMTTMEDDAFKKFCIDKNEEVRSHTVNQLKQLGYQPLPSYTNFLIFPIKKQGSEFVKYMSDHGVGLRSWQFDNKDWCRVSIGTREEMDLFLGVLKGV